MLALGYEEYGVCSGSITSDSFRILIIFILQ